VNRRAAAVLSFALAVALSPLAASAQGLHLKLSSDTPRAAADQPVTVKVQAVALRTLSLPGTPVFLVDDGSGARPLDGAKALEDGAVLAVTPDKGHTGGYELVLTKPGKYKVQAEYRVDGRPVRSNKLTLEITASADAPRAGQ
jgi:hypothetical protein